MATTRTSSRPAPVDGATEVFLSPTATRIVLMPDGDAHRIVASLEAHSLDWESLIALKILMPDAVRDMRLPVSTAANPLLSLLAQSAVGRFVSAEEARTRRSD